MANKRTVLVLGAGASAPYGFPTGQGLVREICDGFELLASQRGSSRFPAETYTAHAKEFVARLRDSGRFSIDTFLQHNPSDRSIGRDAIACTLLPKEIHGSLFNPSRAGENWYQRLFNWLADGPKEDFGKKPLSVITYNYDRSLEHYLLTALCKSFALEELEAAQLASRIPIVHMHGSLGRLPWQAGPGTPIAFGCVSAPFDQVARENVRSAAKQLKIIYEEEIDKDSALLEARRILTEAEQVMFLGFGYDKTNLRRLKLADTLRPGVQIIGSALGLTIAEMDKVKAVFAEFTGHKSTLYDLKLFQWSAIDVIRGTPWLL